MAYLLRRHLRQAIRICNVTVEMGRDVKRLEPFISENRIPRAIRHVARLQPGGRKIVGE
jgi:hypothetical protein